MLSSPLFQPQQSGHALLDALIACGLTGLMATGAWQLVRSSRQLTQAATHLVEPVCENLSCTNQQARFVCSCGEQTWTILR
jgi:hypothetical protein